ncbi:MAG: hypothetical protein J0H08_13715 [Rhizobiales bacterium]|nr:hypothetical protein [Hyphomicrobiales bacterium]
MAFKLPSRVKETTPTAGTGPYALAGAVTSYRAFGAVLSNGDTCLYYAEGGSSWEVGRGTYNAGTLARTAIIASSNGGSAVNWPTGEKTIAIGLPGPTDMSPTDIALLMDVLLAPIEVTVASASTCDILGAASPRVAISGTTTITSFGTGANKIRLVRFAGALTLTHNGTSLILPTGRNIAVEAGDTCLVASDGSSNARVFAYQRASGKSVLPNREQLTANRTYYVRTDGSDSNDGLTNSSGGAFLTLQKAVDVVATLDRSTFNVTVEIGAGTLTAGCDITGWGPGSGQVTFDGAGIGSTTISATSDDCFNVVNARCKIQNMKLQTTTGGCCIRTGLGADVSHGALDFGATALAHIWAEYPGRVDGNGAAYTISGGGIAHILCRYNAVVASYAGAVTLSGTPAFSSAFIVASLCGVVEYGGRSFSGSATGPRYQAVLNAVISTSGGAPTTYLPGNANGTLASGGAYA